MIVQLQLLQIDAQFFITLQVEKNEFEFFSENENFEITKNSLVLNLGMVMTVNF